MSKDIAPFEEIRRRAVDHVVGITEMIAFGGGQRIEDHFVGTDQMVSHFVGITDMVKEP